MEVCSNSQPNRYLPLKSKATFIKVDSIWAFQIKCMFWGNKFYLRESKTKFNQVPVILFLSNIFDRKHLRYLNFWRVWLENFKTKKFFYWTKCVLRRGYKHWPRNSAPLCLFSLPMSEQDSGAVNHYKRLFLGLGNYHLIWETEPRRKK